LGGQQGPGLDRVIPEEDCQCLLQPRLGLVQLALLHQYPAQVQLRACSADVVLVGLSADSCVECFLAQRFRFNQASFFGEGADRALLPRICSSSPKSPSELMVAGSLGPRTRSRIWRIWRASGSASCNLP